MRVNTLIFYFIPPLKAQKLASTEWKWKKNLHPDKNDSWYLDGNA